MPVVLLEFVGVPGTEDYVAVVTLNRPQAKNALNKELSLELASTLGELRSRDDIKVCILMGAGHCFCAGESLSLALG
jgi:enoyl-CoA hydratase